MIHLDSPDDPRLVDYTGLTDVALRRVREPAEGLFIAESSQVIRRALRAGHRPRSLLTAPRWLPDLTDVLSTCDEAGAEVFVAEEPVLEAITGFHVHRGAIASMHRPPVAPAAELLRDARTVVVLEDIVDHTNTSAKTSSRQSVGKTGAPKPPGFTCRSRHHRTVGPRAVLDSGHCCHDLRTRLRWGGCCSTCWR